jgi:Ca2+-binding RTX toxin-like protein
MPVVNDYTALLSGKYWNGIEVSGKPVIITYSFPTSPPAYMASVDGFKAATVNSFQAFSAAEQDQARTALGEWSAASGLIFLEVAPGQGDINFQLVNFNTTSGPSYAGAGGIAFYPFGNWNFFSYPHYFGDLDASGDVFMNTVFETSDTVNYGTLLHEIGHALGLKHPTEVVTNFAASPFVTHDQVLSSDDATRTIMATVGGTDVLKQLDMDAAAFLYGAAGAGGVYTTSASGSNSVSTWSWNAAAQTLTQTGFVGNDTIRGSSVKDVIDGSNGDDWLFGLAGNDTLNGGAGNDTLFGGPGVDSMSGGTEDDTYHVENSSAVITELFDQGFDSVFSYVSYTLSNHIEYLALFGNNLVGTGNTLGNTMFGDGTLKSTLKGGSGDDYIAAGANADVLNGGNDNDTIWGGGGNDVIKGDAGADLLFGEGGRDKLDGNAGVDTMYGGADNDTYTVDDSNDQAIENPGEGTADLVNASATYALGDNIELLTLTGAGHIGGTGNGSANTITGNTGNNTMWGEGGNDSLIGNAGADELHGGAGVDTLEGGTGNDTLHGDADNDKLLGGADNDEIYGGSGLDKINGGTGADTMHGGADNDTYTVDNLGDEVIELENEGAGDSVSSSVSFTLGDNVEKLVLTGSAHNDGTGNNLANTLKGNGGDNVLGGLDGKDTIKGGDGDDTIEGGAGLDALTGDDGADVFVFDAPTGTSTDTIADFTAADGDKLAVHGADYGLAAGALPDASYFAAFGAADVGHGRFLYKAGTKTLFWDADGVSATANAEIAVFDTGVTLAHTSFIVL